MMQAPPQSAFPDPRNNPVLRVLESRQKIQDEADEELSNVGRRGFTGRKYADAATVQLAMMRQMRGEPDQRIEAALSIKKGRLSLIKKGVFAPIHDRF
jgi:3-deoxy-7-phosphoheptulonate synthase